jgi:hypothetical protein
MLSSTVVRDAVPPYLYKGGTTHFPCYSREWEQHGNNRNNRTPAQIWSCSRPWEQDSQKDPLFEAPEKGCCSRPWEQQKWPRKALSHRPATPQCSAWIVSGPLMSYQTVGGVHMGRYNAPAAICATLVPPSWRRLPARFGTIRPLSAT